jgi:hypothetical protein
MGVIYYILGRFADASSFKSAVNKLRAGGETRSDGSWVLLVFSCLRLMRLLSCLRMQGQYSKGGVNFLNPSYPILQNLPNIHNQNPYFKSIPIDPTIHRASTLLILVLFYIQENSNEYQNVVKKDKDPSIDV